MSLFGQSSFGQPTNFGGMTSTTPNPMKDVEITNPPDDSISCLRFSPPSVSNASFLVAGSWDNNVRCWQIQQNGQSDPKSQQTMQVQDCKLRTGRVIKEIHKFIVTKYLTTEFILMCSRVLFWMYVGMMMAQKFLWRPAINR